MTDSSNVAAAAMTAVHKTTPPRHNYHNTNTPIASIKRPRSSLVGQQQQRQPPLAAATSTPKQCNDDSATPSVPSTPMSIVQHHHSDASTSGIIPTMTFSATTTATPGPPLFPSNSCNSSSTPHVSHNMTTPARSYISRKSSDEFSPMHGVRPVTDKDVHDLPQVQVHEGANAKSWVGQKVDALFSPVYHFLHHEEQEQQLRNQHQSEADGRRNANDDTATPMEISCTPEKNSDHGNDNDTQPTASTSSSSESSTDLQTKSSIAIAATESATFDVGDEEEDGVDEENQISIRNNSSADDNDVYAGTEYHVSTGKTTLPSTVNSSVSLDTNNHAATLMVGNTADYDSDDDHSLGRPAQPTDLDEFNPWQFIKSLPEYRRVAHQTPPVALPPKALGAPEKTLVLDLDETLVHCTVEQPETPADLTFPVVFHGTTYTVHVMLRPHLQTFLERLRGKFEIIVFTASQKVYADELLNLIDPKGIYVQHRLFRESCLAVEGNFLKDLNVLGRDLSKTVLVDNSPHAFGYQVDNGIPIESWFDCPSDRELLKLERFLRTLLTVDDVRPAVREKFQSHKLIEESSSIYGM